MPRRRLLERAPSARKRGVGFAGDRVLTFHKRSHDGSAKANAFVCADARVWGVIYDVDEGDLPALDRAEYRGAGYELEAIEIYTEGRVVDCHTYIAMADWVEPGLKPYRWYLDLVVAGAYEHELPAEYIAGIESVAAVVDPDATRRGRMSRLLETL